MSTRAITIPAPTRSGPVIAAVVLASGDVLFGGNFGDVLVKWDGSSVQPVANRPDLGVYALDRASNGDVVVSGVHDSAFTSGSRRVSRWDGATWSHLSWGPFLDQYVLVGSIATGPANEVVAAGSFLASASLQMYSVVRWDGTGCTGLGQVTGGLIYDVAVATNGDVYIAGDFTGIDGVTARSLARFDGSSWHSVGNGVSTQVRHIIATRDGGIAAFGDTAWRFDGSTLQSIGVFAPGDEPAEAIELPNGDLVVAGALTSVDGVPVSNIARFDGSSWSHYGFSNSPVRALALRDDGTVFVAGGTPLPPISIQPWAFEMKTSCPAAAVTASVGCVTGAGLAELAATNLPWLRTTFSGAASGLPSNAVALAITGFNTISVPIASLLPQGVPGCQLLTTLDHTELLPIVAGQAASSLFIPNDPALIAITLRQQVAAFEFAATGQLVAVTSTNALDLTIGSL